MKSRDRNPEIPGSGLYMIVDDRNNVAAEGSGIYGIDLDAVEAALSEQDPEPPSGPNRRLGGLPGAG